MTRVAAVDCGTNSIRLLIADLSGTGATDVLRRMTVVRLGQGVDRTGAFAPEALERTFAAVDDYAREIRAAGVERLRFVATSASRDVSNRDEFVAGVRERLGAEPEVISGEEEARLSFLGATTGLQQGAPPYLVVDLGGGSTELVRGDAEVEQSFSMNIGCVRMTERHLDQDPPTPAAIAAATADIDAALDEAERHVDLTQIATVVGVAGTITTLAAAALELDAYAPDRIHGAQLPLGVLRRITETMLHASRADRAALPYMHPGRVDVIGAGALVYSRVIERIVARAGDDVTLLASEKDILDGIALSLTGA